VLTKSPLVLRDLDLYRGSRARVGVTVTTDREEVARLMEERVAPPLRRIEALAALTDAGLDTHAFVGPSLPMDPSRLAHLLKAATGRVLIDRMNYGDRVAAIYRAKGWGRCLTDAYFDEVKAAFVAEFGAGNVECCW
jgi:DNA repair photolyase